MPATTSTRVFRDAAHRRLVIHDLRERLRTLDADLVFLQEVHGEQTARGAFENWPAAPQYEFLADTVWTDYAYGRNAVYDDGHHGNADPVALPDPALGQRGHLLARLRAPRPAALRDPPAAAGPSRCTACACTSGLWGRHRGRQIEKLRQRIERLVPPAAPLIVAGDFNDWRFRVTHQLAHPLEPARGLRAGAGPAGAQLSGCAAAHVARPHLRARASGSTTAHVHHGRAWARISDHAVRLPRR